jgi:small subunit ribosomal protein S5
MTEEKNKEKIIEEKETKEKPVEVEVSPEKQNSEANAESLDKDSAKVEKVEEKKPWKRKTKEERRKDEEREKLESWVPITELGRKVKKKEIKNIDEILDNDLKILEPEIVDSLLKLDSELISIGQSKGKFGGGKRRAWKQTQRKTKEGNVATFSAFAVVGDKKGHIGIGSGRSAETLPSRDKALRKAKLNIFKIDKACTAFDCACTEKHTVLQKVTGKQGSCKVVLIPAPQGTGLVVADELKKILKLAGIKDVYSQTFGKRKTTLNLVKACVNALKKTNPQLNKNKNQQ